MMRASAFLQRFPLFFLAAVLVALAVLVIGDGAPPARASHGTLATPTSLQATAGDTSVTLTWNQPDTVSGTIPTDIQYGEHPSGSTQEIEHWSVDRQGRTRTISGLTNGTTYRFRVRAGQYTTHAASGWTDWVTATPLAADTLDLSDLTAESSTDGTNFSAMTGAEALAPDFDADTTGYRATVGSGVTHVRLTPTLADSGSSVKVGKAGTTLAPVTSGQPSAAIALVVGDNAITVEVTASDSTTRDYTVTVRRVPTGSVWHATLVPADLGSSFGLGCNSGDTDSSNRCSTQTRLTNDSFTVSGTNYGAGRVTLSSGSLSVTLTTNLPNTELKALNLCVGSTSLAMSEFSSLSYTWSNTGLTWTGGTPVSLSIGTACAQGAASTDADLSELTAGSSTSAGGTFTDFDLTPDFDAATTSYSATVANSITHVKLTPTVADSGATVQVGIAGTTLAPVTSGTASDAISLNVGSNLLVAFVTAEDGNTNNTYSVSITREAAPEGTPVTLVSNATETVANDDARLGSDRTVAQPFGTGDNALGYTLTSVEVQFASNVGQNARDAMKAQVWADSGSYAPGALAYDLTVPDHPITAGTVSFAAPAGAVLSPSTTYWVLVWSSAITNGLKTTASDDETGDAPWVIGNAFRFSGDVPPGGSSTWTTNQGERSVLLTVKGTVTVPAAPVWTATLTAQTESGIGVGCFTTAQCQSRLTDNDFSAGVQSYSVNTLADYDTDVFFIGFPSAINAALRQLNVCVGSREFAFSSATLVQHGTVADSGAEWGSTDIGWSNGDKVQLSIGNTCPPGQPTGLGATAGAASLDLAWTAPTVGTATGYDVHYTSAPSSGQGAVDDDADASGSDPGTAWVAVDRGTEADPPAASQSLTSLTPGTAYRVRVRATNIGGNVGWVRTTGTPTAQGDLPGPVTGLTATAGANRLDFTWTAPSGTVTGYDVESTTDPDGGAWLEHSRTETDPPTTSQSLTGLVNGVEYHVRVRAKNAAGEGPWVRGKGTPLDPAAPTAPQSVTAAPGSAKLTLAWTVPDTWGTYGAANGWYRVEWRGGPNSSWEEVRVSGNPFTPQPGATSLVFAGAQIYDFDQQHTVANGTAYRLRIRATTEKPGASPSVYAHSPWVEVSGTPAVPVAPGAPTVLNVSANDGLLLMMWTAPTTGGAAAGYDFHYTSAPSTGQNAVGNEDAASGSDPSVAWVAVDRGTEADPPLAAAALLGLTNGREYRLRVRATNDGGASAWLHGTGTPAPQLPDMPESLSVTAGDGRLDLGWTQPNADTVTGYDVHYTSAPGTGQNAVGDDDAASGDNPASAWVDAGHTGTTASHALTGLTNGTEYRVRVRGTNATGDGPWARGAGTPLPADMMPAPRAMPTGGVALWSATLTVQDVATLNGQVSLRGCGDGTGKPCTTNLTDNTFRYDGTEHRVTHFTLTPNGYLSFKLNRNLAGEKRRLALVVGGTRFAGRDGTFEAGGKVKLGWRNSGLTWSAGDTVSLSLVEIPTAHLAVSPNPVPEGTQALLEVCLRRGLDVVQGDRNWRYHVPDGDVTVPVIVTPGTAEERDYGEGAAGSDGTRRYSVSINGAHQAACGTVRFWTHRDGDGDDETFTAMLDTNNLPSSLVAGSPSSVEVTIKETDESELSVPFVRLTGPGRPVVEGGSVTLTASLHIGDLPTFLQQDVFIPLVVRRETSEEGDHGTVGGVTIKQLQRSASVVIPTHRDGDGDDEFFTVSIGFRPTSPVQASGRYGSVRVRIAEREPPLVSLEASPNPVHEGNTVTVTARLSQAMSTDLTLPVTVTGIDSEGGDHDGLSSITVPRGQTTGTGTIATHEDEDTDDERFTVALGSVPLPAAAVSPTSVEVTIADLTEPGPAVPTDTHGLLSVSPSPAQEGKTVTLTATLDDPAPSGGIAVQFYTADGDTNSASADDYTLSPSAGQGGSVFQDWTPEIRIPAGQRTATATLSIAADGIAEGDETLTVQLFVSFRDRDVGYIVPLTIQDAAVSSSTQQNDPCDNCGTGGDTGAVSQGQDKYAGLIARMKEWRNDPEWVSEKAHTDRWDRALLAFGETVEDTTLTPMTAAEAQGFADKGWERWVEVAAALRVLQNRAPTVSSGIADVTIVSDSGSHAVSLSGVFDDPDGDSLTMSVMSSDEATATASASSDGSTLTVTARLRGTATITVTAADSYGGAVEDSFTVTVKAAPLVASAIVDVSGLEAGATQDISLAGVFSDPDGDALTISTASDDEAVATVSVAADGSKLTLTGVAEGTATITVTAQDSDGNTVSDAFQVEVSAESKYAALIAKMYQWRNDPQWVSEKPHTDRWDRALLAFGEAVADTTLTPMTAAEAQGFADRGWERWVEVAAALREIEGGGQPEQSNQAPMVSASIADATIVSESGTEEVSLSGVFSDADNDALTVSAASSAEAVATVSVASGGSTLTVNAQARGTATITVTADDGNGGAVEDSFTVTVKAAPLVISAIADVSGLEAGSTRDVSLSGVFSDADGDSLTVSAASGDDAIATVSVASDGSTLTLTGVAEGTATISVTAEDSDSNRVMDDFDVSVAAQQQQQPSEPPNQAPTVNTSIADVTIVNESGTHAVSLSGVFDDADGDGLTVTAASSDEAKATVSVSSDRSSLMVTAKSRGTAVITVTAKDGNGGTVEDTFTVTVKAAPVVASAISDVSGLEAGATQDISLAGVFSDADGDALTVSAVSGDDAVATVSVASGGSTLTLTGVAEGTATISVTAQDSDGNRVTDGFAVSVVAQQQPSEPPNQAPTVNTSIADVTIVNESGTHAVSLSGVFDDADGDGLTVSAASSDEAIATVSVSSDGSGLTVNAQARGTAVITVTADDGNGGTVEDSFTVTIKAAPVVASAVADMSLKAGATQEEGGAQDVSLSSVFSDADGDALTFTVETSDFEVAEAFLLQGTLTVLAVADGSATITVTAQDSDGNTVSDSFDVSVVGPPRAGVQPELRRADRPGAVPVGRAGVVGGQGVRLRLRPDPARREAGAGPAPGLPVGAGQGRVPGGPGGQHQREGGVRAGRRERGEQRGGDADLHRGGVARRHRGRSPWMHITQMRASGCGWTPVFCCSGPSRQGRRSFTMQPPTGRSAVNSLQARRHFREIGNPPDVVG